MDIHIIKKQEFIFMSHLFFSNVLISLINTNYILSVFIILRVQYYKIVSWKDDYPNSKLYTLVLYIYSEK